MYKLEIRDDEGRTTSVPLERLLNEEITIGRREGNSIRLTERNVSRVHAKLSRHDGAVFLQDTSRYGTRLNGHRLRETEALSHGDIIHIGDYQLAFEVEQSAGVSNQGETRDEEVRAGDTAPVKRGRLGAAQLVVVNGELAGTSYPLLGESLVVGRQEDNDIHIDHRSVSKQHVRLTSANGAWSVEDLGSANGLRINGEVYRNTVLKRGDILELGHVKVRFVGAGEAYTYSPLDEQELDGSKGRGGLLIFAFVGIAAIGLGVAWFGTYSKPSQDTLDLSKPIGVTAAEQRLAPSAGERAQGVTPAKSLNLGPQLARADELMKARQWDDAMGLYQAILDEDPSNAEAKLGAALAAEEKETQALYEGVMKLHKAGDLADAWAKASDLKQIPPNSAFHAQAMERHKAIAMSYGAKLLSQGESALRNKRYRQAINFAERALTVQPDNEDAQTVRDRARRKERESKGGQAAEGDKSTADSNVAQGTPKARVEAKAKPAAESAATETKSPEDEMSARDLYRAARDAHRKGIASKAISLYSKAAAKGSAKAYRQLGTLYAGSGKTGPAIKAWKRYLKLKPGASDAEAIRNAIIRHGGTPP